MAKVAYDYYKVHPWQVIEEGFNPERSRVSESIFSIGNEYMGVRGYMEEGISCDSLLGSYFNGIYEYGTDEHASHYKGIVTQTHFMVNSVNWLYTRIYVDGVQLDLNKSLIKDFRRVLDFKKGQLTRTFILLQGEKEVEFTFKRFVSMVHPEYGYQTIEAKVLNAPATIKIRTGLDLSIVHWGKHNYWNRIKSEVNNYQASFIGKTISTNQRVFSGYTLHTSTDAIIPFEEEKCIGHDIEAKLAPGEALSVEKQVANLVEKQNKENDQMLWNQGYELLNKQASYGHAFIENAAYWQKVWEDFDIEIDGDLKNQQGIRFCIFQLVQTYHGVDPVNNIGAKGLTGEAYSGHAFWDTETYCLPFFIFNNPQAAKNLLMYRYNTLKQAKIRALELDCVGACYPIATLNGNEACTLWQHASLQFQPSTAVAYGIWHYVKLTKDLSFLYDFGLELLIEISRFLLSRGQWNASGTKFGYYGVMGPDEFQMMVNHNAYTNYMAKKTFEYTLEVLEDVKKNKVSLYNEMMIKTGLKDEEQCAFETAAKNTYIPYDHNTKIYEQHEGYFDLPNIDVNSIPVTDFPLYSNWSYDRIYRNNMIKQPDVLMFMFLYNQSFDFETKKANYEYYDPKTIHESSLSPSIHSIFASELDKEDEAVHFFGFATRMDLDDYNRNTNEGLHTTSIAAAWVNILYGFGGLRSDGDKLVLNPMIPSIWNGYAFKFKLMNSLINVKISKNDVIITSTEESTLVVYDQEYTISKEPLILPVKNKRG